MYEVQFLTEQYFKIFKGVYEDFKLKSKSDFKFELEPLDYIDFIGAFEKKLINCLILLEDGIPTAFLAYSTEENMALELYLIHCIGNVDLENKASALVKFFLENTENIRDKRIVSYPMLGVQKKYQSVLKSYGFDFVDIGVMSFDIESKEKRKNFLDNFDKTLPIGFSIVPYSKQYFDEVSIVINSAFESSNDAKYDERFLTITGSIDIQNKTITSIYGKFIDEASSILLYENKVVGFTFVNIIGRNIANITLVGIVPEFRGQKLSAPLIGYTLRELIKLYDDFNVDIANLNVSVDLSNLSAYNMYKKAGFKETYMYPQAYLQKIERIVPAETEEEVEWKTKII